MVALHTFARRWTERERIRVLLQETKDCLQLAVRRVFIRGVALPSGGVIRRVSHTLHGLHRLHRRRPRRCATASAGVSATDDTPQRGFQTEQAPSPQSTFKVGLYTNIGAGSANERPTPGPDDTFRPEARRSGLPAIDRRPACSTS